MSKTRLGMLGDFVEGKAKGFDPRQTGADRFFVVRKGEALFAYKDACPHYRDTSLPWKRHEYLDGDAQHIVCAAHGALFEIDSGYCVRGPCVGDSLTMVPLEISSDQQVWINNSIIEEFDL